MNDNLIYYTFYTILSESFFLTEADHRTETFGWKIETRGGSASFAKPNHWAKWWDIFCDFSLFLVPQIKCISCAAIECAHGGHIGGEKQ